MANNKLLAIVTVMILMGSNAESEPTLEDLITIDRLIETGNWRALYNYIEANPRLTTGTSALAGELRTFTNDVKSGQLNVFNAPPAPGVTTTESEAGAGVSIY